MSWKILEGDVRDRLAELPDESVHSCVTSPPYWGLRDYGIGGQLGLEPSPEEYVSNMVAVFREVWRVLRSDGTLWLNLGDSYGGNRGNKTPASDSKYKALGPGSVHAHDREFDFRKQLIGIPWRVAFALQTDGWYLRSDIIWHKPNPMPESVTDRPTKSHEYIFLLTKSERYFYDADAVREPHADDWHDRASTWRKGNAKQQRRGDTYHPFKEAKPFENPPNPLGRNRRTVWTVTTQPFKGAHFATFPPKLIEPCILAGSSERGCCPTCGAPWRRLVERESITPKDYEGKHLMTDPQASGRRMLANVRARREAGNAHDNPFPAPKTIGWEPTCLCPEHKPGSCTVLDPFSGAGTTGLVAVRHGRNYVGIELNPEYAAMSRKRIAEDAPLFNRAS